MSKIQSQANTLIERMGFRDSNLSTPEHDEIMCWLNSNIHILISFLIGDRLADWNWRTNSDYINYAEIAAHNCPKPKRIKLKKFEISTQWEVPIKYRNDKTGYEQIVGFGDLLAQVESSYSDVTCKCRKGRWEECTHMNILFEVKSKIPSLGELMRQISLYSQYKVEYCQVNSLSFNDIVVVTPDTRFVKQLINIGVAVIPLHRIKGKLCINKSAYK